MGAIAIYVIDRLTEILGEQPEREKSYPWAIGDISSKTGRAARLPFDAVWESRKLIVEIAKTSTDVPSPSGTKRLS